jgi:hypothetical protein
MIAYRHSILLIAAIVMSVTWSIMAGPGDDKADPKSKKKSLCEQITERIVAYDHFMVAQVAAEKEFQKTLAKISKLVEKIDKANEDKQVFAKQEVQLRAEAKDVWADVKNSYRQHVDARKKLIWSEQGSKGDDQDDKFIAEVEDALAKLVGKPVHLSKYERFVALEMKSRGMKAQEVAETLYRLRSVNDAP